MKSCKLRIAIALLLLSIFSASFPVLAGNSNVPSSLLSYRDSLLGQKKTLLDYRAEANNRLTRLETARRASDAFLNTDCCKEQYDRVIAARTQIVQRINDLQSWLSDIEKAIIATDSDLRDVESRINAWACLK